MVHYILLDEICKGVKKLGLSMELSYANIRKYMVNHLNRCVRVLVCSVCVCVCVCVCARARVSMHKCDVWCVTRTCVSW